MSIILMIFISCGPQKPASIASSVESRTELNAGFSVWQGFSFDWTYNHRLSRFGSYVTFDSIGSDSYQVSAVQTAATGIGDDLGVYTQDFTFVYMEGAEVIKKQIDFHLENRRGKSVESTEVIEFNLRDRQFSNPKIVTLLNGFDLIAQNSPHKLQMINLEVSDAEYDSKSEKGTYTVTAALNMDCRSIECNKLDRRYDYILKVNVVLIAVPAYMHVTRDTVSADFDWTRKKEPVMRRVTRDIQGEGQNRYSSAFLGIKQIETHLAREFWYINWNKSADLAQYDPQTGIGTVDYNLLYGNWKPGMRQDSPERIESQFSFKEIGSGDMRLITEMVQFSRGCTEKVSVRDSIQWSGKRTQPETAESVSQVDMRFTPDCILKE